MSMYSRQLDSVVFIFVVKLQGGWVTKCVCELVNMDSCKQSHVPALARRCTHLLFTCQPCIAVARVNTTLSLGERVNEWVGPLT
jgi:hypothetical protein